MLSVYYSIFYSHLTYACQVWSLTTQHNIDAIKILQKKCLRIINFAPYNSHSNILFRNDKLLKSRDIIKLEQMKIIFEFKSNSLSLDLNNLFQENKKINCHFTRNVTKEGLCIPQIRTKTYGSKSLKYSAANEINNITKMNGFKKYLKKFYLSFYNADKCTLLWNIYYYFLLLLLIIIIYYYYYYNYYYYY